MTQEAIKDERMVKGAIKNERIMKGVIKNENNDERSDQG
jgi:hypothetical protein